MKIRILTSIVFVSAFATIYGQRKASTRSGIQNKGDWRIKIIYPFTRTLKQGQANFELNRDNSLDNYQKSGSGYYKLGIHETIGGDTNMYFHEENRLSYRFGAGAEYVFHKRFPVEFGIKTWRFRKNWDTNHVAQIGHFQHLSFPINIKYEVFRRKYVSLKAGFGYEPSIKFYRNFAEINDRCTKHDLILIFPVCVESETTFATKNRTQYNFSYIGDLYSLELSLGIRISKRFSLDLYSRFSELSNTNQVSLNYLLN